MKKIIKKRIVLYCPWNKEEIIGAEEYDGSLSDDNIIGAFYEVGRTEWHKTKADCEELWYIREYNGKKIPYYKVGIGDFYVEVPSFWDKIKRALFV